MLQKSPRASVVFALVILLGTNIGTWSSALLIANANPNPSQSPPDSSNSTDSPQPAPPVPQIGDNASAIPGDVYQEYNSSVSTPFRLPHVPQPVLHTHNSSAEDYRAGYGEFMFETGSEQFASVATQQIESRSTFTVLTSAGIAVPSQPTSALFDANGTTVVYSLYQGSALLGSMNVSYTFLADHDKITVLFSPASPAVLYQIAWIVLTNLTTVDTNGLVSMRTPFSSLNPVDFAGSIVVNGTSFENVGNVENNTLTLRSTADDGSGLSMEFGDAIGAYVGSYAAPSFEFAGVTTSAAIVLFEPEVSFLDPQLVQSSQLLGHSEQRRVFYDGQQLWAFWYGAENGGTQNYFYYGFSTDGGKT
jgi:hypothetical protein